jgi:hypothetical protein
VASDRGAGSEAMTASATSGNARNFAFGINMMTALSPSITCVS